MVAAMTVAPEVWAKDVQAQKEQNEFTLEEITVTATKRETALEDTALALSVVTGDMINEQGRNDIYDVLKDIPGVTFGAEWAEGALINVRGIGGGILIESHGDPAVATTMDGSYASPLMSNPLDIGFYDIARVEMLRGPQGTLYGRNAEGGVMNVISNDPSNTKEVSGTIELGSYHLIRGSAMVNTPLSENTALRLAFQHNDRDSYYTSGAGKVNNASGRLKYLYKPSDDFRFLVGLEFTKELPASAPMVNAWGLGDYPIDIHDNASKDGGLSGSIPAQPGDERVAKLWAQFDWETPFGTVTYLPSYNQKNSHTVSYALKTMGVPYIWEQSTSDSKVHQSSFEARLASKSSKESVLDYVIGIFYLDAVSTTLKDVNGGYALMLDYEVGQGSKAVFGQGTYHFTDKFRGTLGLRYTNDSKRYHNIDTYFGLGGENSAKKEWTRTDYKVGVEMDIFEEGMAYADVATGYRPGTANVRASATALDALGNVVPYPNQFSEPEKLLAYEMGAKTSFFNKRMDVSLDAYYYNYTNRQYTELFPAVPLNELCFNGTKPVESLSFIPGTGICYEERNMGKVVAKGAELSTTTRATDFDTVNLSVAYLNAYVAESQMVLVHALPNVIVDAKGATMPNSPEWEINLGWEHRFDFEAGSLLLRGDGRYTSECYVQDFSYLYHGTNTVTFADGKRRTYLMRDIYTSEAHTSYDFTATFLTSEGGYTFSAYVKNITDKYWKTRTDGTNNSISEPRTYGVIFSERF
jgi:iron complex outermembrane receptor protein